MQVDSYSTVQQLLGRQPVNLHGILAGGKAKEGKESDATGYLSAAYNEVTISAFGKQINEFYQSMKSIDDPAAREAASEGLTAVMRQFTAEPDSLRTANFMRNMEETRQSDPDAFRDFFTTANEVDQGGYGLGRWVDTYSRIEDRDAQRAYVDESRDIMAAGGEEDAALRGQTFDHFVDDVNQIADSGLEGEALRSRYDQYFGGMNQQQELEDKQAFMDEFNEETGVPAASESGAAG